MGPLTARLHQGKQNRTRQAPYTARNYSLNGARAAEELRLSSGISIGVATYGRPVPSLRPFAAQSDTMVGYLKVAGTRIVDEEGKDVILRGAGLGGWMT